MSDEITYRGFNTPDQNAAEVETWLGDEFASHVPTQDRVEFFAAGTTGYTAAAVGDRLRRVDGRVELVVGEGGE